MLLDERHEFLERPGPRRIPHSLRPWPEWSPEVDVWIDHLERTGARYELRRRAGRVMIFTHRVVTAAGKRSGLRRPRWCCGRSSRRLLLAKVVRLYLPKRGRPADYLRGIRELTEMMIGECERRLHDAAERAAARAQRRRPLVGRLPRRRAGDRGRS